MNNKIFQTLLLAWFDDYGRKDLPWQRCTHPYHVWISEIMLQQTQVNTVIPYYLAFMQRFPSLDVLAFASVDDVLPYWSGLGYYARARNLHTAAQIITKQGYFPDTLEALTALPGIGLSTAGAILSIAFNQRQPILDGNVKRVLSRYQGIDGWPGSRCVEKKLWQISADFTPAKRVAEYTQAIMDLGATVCKRSNPICISCPLKATCHAFVTDTVAQYPVAKPKKTLPTKEVFFLMLINRNRQVFLEKRPSKGIWGGLWSLPEFASLETLQSSYLVSALAVQQHVILPTQYHVFSHYRLRYVPVRIYVDMATDNITEQKGCAWWELECVEALGLAAPIKKLLIQLHQGE
ncbi:MAG: A/G-specific adenine glycosylase [Methylovulum sp.]|jgi:A/G-specific adenine glycosylase|nr:A/G-specific adenine glycosylase [Methylovulum sp.]